MPAWELHRTALPCKAASAIAALQPVTWDTGDVQRQVVPLATTGVEPVGLAVASAPLPGDAVSVHDFGNVVKVQAAASIGHGADVAVASTNGAFGPIAGASGVIRWRVGKSVTAAAAGEYFSVYVNPRQLGGLA